MFRLKFKAGHKIINYYYEWQLKRICRKNSLIDKELMTKKSSFGNGYIDCGNFWIVYDIEKVEP